MMTPATDSFWDILSQDEADFVRAIMPEAGNQPWAQPIIAGINNNGGLEREDKDRRAAIRRRAASFRCCAPIRDTRRSEIYNRFWI
jgi:hypothetical protein